MKVQDWIHKDNTSRKLERQLPKYRMLARVGQGQFGQVFCAVDRQTKQLVALKEITHKRLSTSKFLRELGSLLTLQHPNIVTCRAFEETTAARYLVMDYCEGGTLRELLEQENSLNLGEALALMQAILSGLEQAHNQNIIHCDIKPENILLGLENGMWLPRLSDFGIARRLSEISHSRISKSVDGSIEVVGAPAYTSPEAFYGMYSRTSDIYAMGVVLFELLLGYRPFTGMPERLMWVHLNQPLEIPAMVPEPLQAILKQALAKLKGRRYKTAAEMLAAIAALGNNPQMQAFMEKSLPFRSSEEPIVDLPVPYICIVHQEELPAISTLCSGSGYLYGCSNQKTLSIWSPSKTQATTVMFHESIHEICPTRRGCFVSTDPLTEGNADSIYWLPLKHQRPERLLTFEQPFTFASDPIARWLVVARQERSLKTSHKPTIKLKFYVLGHGDEAVQLPSIKLWRSVSLSVGMLPQLMFLDRKHILAIWRQRNPKKPQTVFHLYSRRGTQIGSIRLPMVFEQLVSSDASGILFGIAHHPRPALWCIQLMPLKLKRIPLTSEPTCLSSIPGGCVLANAKGEIILLDCEGYNHGTFQFGFEAPLGLATWGVPTEETSEKLLGLAGIVPAANGRSHISLIQLKYKGLSHMPSVDI